MHDRSEEYNAQIVNLKKANLSTTKLKQ